MAHNCYRCGGKGRIDTYSHVAYGICFACGGNPDVPPPPQPQRLTYAEAYAKHGEIVDELVALGRLEHRLGPTRIADETIEWIRTEYNAETTDPEFLRYRADEIRRRLRLGRAPLARLMELVR
ncbi:hypothetical protein [Actinomadura macra]|uniref:hypothetical protein n=1 Tax=Actinomadura macra TaxID=46164 RepID=UPI000829E45B|nr:hypothetical protein [Actinomadura macra]